MKCGFHDSPSYSMPMVPQSFVDGMLTCILYDISQEAYTLSDILQAAHPLSVSAESKRADVRYEIEL